MLNTRLTTTFSKHTSWKASLDNRRNTTEIKSQNGLDVTPEEKIFRRNVSSSNTMWSWLHIKEFGWVWLFIWSFINICQQKGRNELLEPFLLVRPHNCKKVLLTFNPNATLLHNAETLKNLTKTLITTSKLLNSRWTYAQLVRVLCLQQIPVSAHTLRIQYK